MHRNLGGTDKHFHTKWLLVDLNTLQGSSGLASVLGLVENDCDASKALTVRAVVNDHPLQVVDLHMIFEVFLWNHISYPSDKKVSVKSKLHQDKISCSNGQRMRRP